MPADGARILVVEDNQANMLLIQAVLRRGGYEPIEAFSAEEALERLGRSQPDLILMDVQLPGADGLSLTRQLKADPATASIPIVVLTAHAMSSDRERALAAGCDGYLPKPINTRTLVGELAAVLESAQSRQGGAA